MKNIKKKGRRQAVFQGWFFLSPALLILVVFVMIAIGFGIFISFNKVNLFTGYYKFIGLENYTRIFTDTKAKIAFKNTTFFVAVVVPCQTIFIYRNLLCKEK